MKVLKESVGQQVEKFKSYFCPYGYDDIEKAIEVSQESNIFETKNVAGELYDLIEGEAENMGMKIKDVDPVYIIYEHILQMARNEIEKNTKFDFINDIRGEEIYTAGNIIRSYDCSEEALEQLLEVLQNNGLVIKDFSDATQWFLEEIDLSDDL